MIASTSRIKLLQGQSFFGGITDEIVTLILELSPETNVPRGHYFFREGDSAGSMYVLESGQVAVIMESHGTQYLLRKLNPGDCFGEMAMMDFMPRSASVYAIVDSSAIEITLATLRRIFTIDPEQFTMIEMNMGREVCRRLRTADHLIIDKYRTLGINGFPDEEELP
jgi:CRP/FNR family transcriptional regulator, cyclic AMP receptor protein